MKYRILCLLLILCMLTLCACPGGEAPTPPPEENPGNTTPATPDAIPPIYGNGNPISEAGAKETQENIPDYEIDIDEGEEVGAEAFFHPKAYPGESIYIIMEEVILSNQMSNLTSLNGNTYVFAQGLTIDGASNLTLSDGCLVGDINMIDADTVSFKNMQIIGAVTVEDTVANLYFSLCSLNELTNIGTNLTVLDCIVTYNETGISDQGVGTYIENCFFYGNGTALHLSGQNTTVRECSLSPRDTTATGVRINETVNTLLALNRIEGVQTSLHVKNSFNCVVARNSFISADAEDNRHLYVVDNEMGGRLTARRCSYLLADGNNYPSDGKNHTPVLEDNSNQTGNLTPSTSTVAYGVNEAELPKTDPRQFDGMERRTHVRCSEGERAVSGYVNAEVRDGSRYVFISPGAYTAQRETSIAILHLMSMTPEDGVTVYAYGVYFERETANAQHLLRMDYSKNIEIKGLTMGYAASSHMQFHIIDKTADGYLRLLPSAGLQVDEEGFDTPQYACHFVRQSDGEYAPRTKYTVEAHTLVGQPDGTYLLYTAKPYYFNIGDVLAFSGYDSSVSVSLTDSDNLLFQDVTIYSDRGTAFGGYMLGGNIIFNRLSCTPAAAGRVDEETRREYADILTAYSVDSETVGSILHQEEDGYIYGAAAQLGATGLDFIYTEGDVKITSSRLCGATYANVDISSNQASPITCTFRNSLFSAALGYGIYGYGTVGTVQSCSFRNFSQCGVQFDLESATQEENICIESCLFTNIGYSASYSLEYVPIVINDSSTLSHVQIAHNRFTERYEAPSPYTIWIDNAASATITKNDFGMGYATGVMGDNLHIVAKTLTVQNNDYGNLNRMLSRFLALFSSQ